MTSEEARTELNRANKLKQRIEFLQLRLKHNSTCYNESGIDDLQKEIDKLTKVHKKYVQKITERLRKGLYVKPRDEQMLTLRFIDGYTNTELSRIMDKTYESIKSMVHYALKRYALSYDYPLE